MSSNKTDEPVAGNGWLYYDGDCALCRRWVRRAEPILVRRQIHLRTLQSPEAPQRLGLSGPALLHEMRLLLPDGRNLGGADAVVEMTRRIWWAWPLWLVSRVPGMLALLRKLYRFIAARRHCADAACQAPRPRAWLDR